MNPQINAVTIAATNIKVLRKFYHDALGWKVLTENESVVMFKLNQTVFTICANTVFAEYSGSSTADGAAKGFYLTINMDSPKQVDQYFKKLEAADVPISKMPKKTFWGGYGGFFADPEGNKWEVCYNPIPETKA
jgi:uncharacterized glyoxalase superfamily protein PhnB